MQEKTKPKNIIYICSCSFPIKNDCFVYFVFYRDDASEEDKQTITIAEKYIHPGYDTPDKANDIALLKLKEPIRMGPTISSPCIPDQNDFGDSSSFPAGIEIVISISWFSLIPKG